MVKQEYADVRPEGQKRVSPARATTGKNMGLTGITSGFVWLFLSLVPACSPGGEPPPSVPDPVVAFVGATEVQVVPSGPGLAYYSLRNLDEPWAVHILRVDLSHCELGLEVLEAPVSQGEGRGWSRVSELLAVAGDGIQGGVNGDFFTAEGLPVGTEVVSGTTRRVLDRPALAWRPTEDPWVGVPEVLRDSVLVLGWELARFQSDGETEVIGGFPLLLVDGEIVGDLEVSERPSFAAERHPRTAVGFDLHEEVLWVTVVDGRQPDYSMGMTLPELAGLMEALSVEDAINLDGGGSSVMVVRGAIVSRPSDADGERPVVNALGIRRDSAFCRPEY